MNTITDIFFDLDHTLWDFNKNSTLAFEKIFSQRNITIDISQFVKKYTPINGELWLLYQIDKLSHVELRYQRLRKTFDLMNYSISDENINQISIDYINFLPENNWLFDGTIEVLDYLFPHYSLHIISNGLADVQQKKIINSGLDKYFKTVTFPEMAGVKKPHKNIYEYAFNLAKAQKQSSVMIGDCMEADFKGAIDFGIRAILFDEKKEFSSKGIHTINHLTELKNIF